MVSRRALTLMEILVVLVIIGVLMGILVPAGRIVLGRREVQTTRTLVQAVAAAIAAYQVRGWEVRVAVDTGGGKVLRQALYPSLWDLNQSTHDDKPGDGIIDGRPGVAADDTHDGPFWSGLIDSGYRGFAAMAMSGLPAANRNARGQPIDAWKQPLRIAWQGANAGPGGYRIWSIGRDGVSGTDDDISDAEQR